MFQAQRTASAWAWHGSLPRGVLETGRGRRGEMRPRGEGPLGASVGILRERISRDPIVQTRPCSLLC